MQKSIPIRVRIFNHSDREFVTSLIARFSEFELPASRMKNDVDNANRISLQKAMEELEPGSVISSLKMNLRTCRFYSCPDPN
jgi:hypothetical protein